MNVHFQARTNCGREINNLQGHLTPRQNIYSYTDKKLHQGARFPEICDLASTQKVKD